MIAIIATAIACFIVGGVLSYILFRYVLKSKYDNVPERSGDGSGSN